MAVALLHAHTDKGALASGLAALDGGLGTEKV